MRRYSLPLCALLLAVPLLAARTEPVRVTARKGAVELSLTVESVRLKAGQVPAIRLDLKNVGRRPFLITRDIFTNPDSLLANCGTKIATHLELRGPDGKTISPDPLPSDAATPAADPCPGLKAAAQRQADEWAKQGLSREEINTRFLRWEQPPCPGRDSEAVLKVSPQESASFPLKGALPYFPLELFRFGVQKPGKYEVRAVYDMAPGKELESLYRKGNLQREANEVRLATKWISLELR